MSDSYRRRRTISSTTIGDVATIDGVFAEFLDEGRARLSERSYQQYEQVIELFAMSMNGYAPNALTDDEFERWQERFETDELSAFTGLFGPDKIAENVGEFLDYFMIRKVMARKELLESAGTVTAKLADWLASNGHVDATTAAVMVDQGSEASTELPALDKLADLLYDDAERLPEFDAADIPDEHWIDDYLTIVKVEPGALWFEGLDAPLAVSTRTSKAAQPGWTVNVEAVKLDGRWHAAEVGKVYP